MVGGLGLRCLSSHGRETTAQPFFRPSYLFAEVAQSVEHRTENPLHRGLAPIENVANPLGARLRLFPALPGLDTEPIAPLFPLHYPSMRELTRSDHGCPSR